MNFVYDPKIAAMSRSERLHLVGQGRREEAIKLDPDSRRTRSSSRRTTLLSKVVHFDSAALNNQTYIEKWQKLLGA